MDDRESFLYSSSLAPAPDNLNRLYLYNYIRGRLVNIPRVNTGNIRVSFYSGSATKPTGAKILLPNGGGVATDNGNAIAYGTGSQRSTFLSYDKEGNYFDLDMSLLEGGYMYQINLSYYNDSIGDWQLQPQAFKFRVEE